MTLKQNPHFYQRLPTLTGSYGGKFRMDPIETFRYEKVSVLIDNPGQAGRVFLETARRRRVFGNVWAENNRIFFKGSRVHAFLCPFSLSDNLLDVSGKLEGEKIVGEAIGGTPNLWCFEEHPLSLASQPALSPSNPDSPSSLTVTTTKITSAAGELIRDWRVPIHRMLESRDVNIRITDKPPRSRNRTDVPPYAPGREGPVRARAKSRVDKPASGGMPRTKLKHVS